MNKPAKPYVSPVAIQESFGLESTLDVIIKQTYKLGWKYVQGEFKMCADRGKVLKQNDGRKSRLNRIEQTNVVQIEKDSYQMFAFLS